MSSPDPFAAALDRHRTGDLDAAEAAYRRILEANAGHAGAWHLLGVVHTQRGRPEQAVAFIGRALALRPNEGGFHLNLGVAYEALGRSSEAEASFRRAVELAPRFAEAHNNLANALYGRGAVADARTHWGYALGLHPQYAEAHHNLARALADAGEWAPAAQHAKMAVDLRPDFAPGHFHLGVVLTRLGQFPAAADGFRQALRGRPDWPEALCGLGHVLAQLGDWVGAEACLRRAVQAAPGSADAHNELGKLLGGRGRLDEALEHFQRAVRADPADAESQHNLGVALHRRRQLGPAEAHLREALRLRPGFLEVYPPLTHVLVQQGRVDDALTLCRAAVALAPGSALLHTALGDTLAQAGWVAEAAACFRQAVRVRPDDAVAHSCLLNTLNFDPMLSPAELLAEHRRWAEQHAGGPPLGPGFDHDRAPERTLRVGYLSADFRQHVLAHFLEPILTGHDRERIEAFAYADVAAPDAVTARLRGLVPQWRSLCGRSDDEAARSIQADRIDILVDLGGHTSTRLGVFARQPAPVKATYLGYPNTTGLDRIHYRLTDDVADPPGEPPCHTEELVRLPGGFCCYEPPRDAPEVTPLPALTAGHITFGSLHKLSKFNDRVLDLWCDVLRAVPTSRLLVFRDVLRGPTADRYREEFTRRGIAAERVRLEHQVKHPIFLAVYGEVDVALDALPWTGHATACEALWMGVPTLTLLGDRHAGRMVASVLTQVGLTEFVARTPEEFVARAVAAANDRDRLASLRAALRERVRSSPLCDGPSFTRGLEAAYRSMWRRWVEAAAPDR